MSIRRQLECTLHILCKFCTIGELSMAYEWQIIKLSATNLLFGRKDYISSIEIPLFQIILGRTVILSSQLSRMFLDRTAATQVTSHLQYSFSRFLNPSGSRFCTIVEIEVCCTVQSTILNCAIVKCCVVVQY